MEWKIHLVSVVWSQQLALWTGHQGTVHNTKCLSFLPLASFLAVLHTARHALWAKACWLAYAFNCSLCCICEPYQTSAKDLIHISRFSKLAYSNRIIALEPSLHQPSIMCLNLDIFMSLRWNHESQFQSRMWLTLIPKEWLLPCEHLLCLNQLLALFLYRACEKDWYSVPYTGSLGSHSHGRREITMWDAEVTLPKAEDSLGLYKILLLLLPMPPSLCSPLSM